MPLSSPNTNFGHTEAPLPFTVEQLPGLVYDTYDREQIAHLIVEKLGEYNIDPNEVILTGFNATNVIDNGGYGDRNTTYGVGTTQMFAYEDPDDLSAVQSPVYYLEKQGGSRPAIGVYWLKDLVNYFDDPVTPDELNQSHIAELEWKTANGESLDSAAAVLFLF